MTASGNIRDRDAVVTEVPGSRVVKTAVHHGAELELDPLRHTEPMKLVAHDSCQSAVVFPRARES